MHTKWTRKDFPAPPLNLSLRERAELETERDLQKPIQQLVCDVHEEIINPLPPQHTNERLVGAQKRMVSMMGRVALEHERSTTVLVRLTWALVFLTIAIIALTAVMLVKM